MGKENDQKIVQKLRAAGGKTEHLPEAGAIALAFLKRAGGVEGFSAMLWKDYDSADAGSISRQRIGASIIEILKNEQARKPGLDTDAMTDEELLDVARGLAVEAEVVDAAPAAGPTADPREAAPQAARPRPVAPP